MNFAAPFPGQSSLWQAIDESRYADEGHSVRALLGR